MDEIDREVLATIAEDVLGSDLENEVMTAAREMFEAGVRTGTWMTVVGNWRPSSVNRRG
jgi:hypothetical protein